MAPDGRKSVLNVFFLTRYGVTQLQPNRLLQPCLCSLCRSSTSPTDFRSTHWRKHCMWSSMGQDPVCVCVCVCVHYNWFEWILCFTADLKRHFWWLFLACSHISLLYLHFNSFSLSLSPFLWPFSLLSLCIRSLSFKVAVAYSSNSTGWCVWLRLLDKGSGFVLNLFFWCRTPSCLFSLPLCIFCLFENASSNPIIRWSWNGKTQTRNPLHCCRKTSLKQNRRRERETDNAPKGCPYSSVHQNTSPVLTIVLSLQSVCACVCFDCSAI